MLSKTSPVQNRLLDEINRIPVIDCHEHLRGPVHGLAQQPTEPILFLSEMYLLSDLWASGATDAEIRLLQDPERPTDHKWPLFVRLWAATEHTAYAQVTKRVLREQFSIEDLTRESLEVVADKIRRREASGYLQLLKSAGIRAVLTDALFSWQPIRHISYFGNRDLQDFLEKRFELPAGWRPLFPLPYFHELRHFEFLEYVSALSDSDITSLDDYESAVFDLMVRSREAGVIGLKDQSAYRRVISYSLPPRADAERLFNRLLVDPRNQLAWPDAQPLDDYLFHQFVRFAQDLGWPVQIHTGHMAGMRNRVAKANAVHFSSVLELHTRVRFDLFHGNWPYMGDLLFLGKNYPNVSLNLCWLPMIDPIYAEELLRRAVMTVPHAKIHAFGGDFRVQPEFSVAQLGLAREIIAGALASLVESGWLDEADAVSLAADWLFNNPNRFYGIGLPTVTVGTAAA